MRKRISLIVLSLIFVLALGVRLYELGNMPSGFHRDEVISGFVGRFILENGQDIYGNSWPLLYVDKYGDYPPVIPMYVSGAATYLFGVNVFATRFPVAFIGALSVLLIFFLGKELFKEERIALLAALLLAILPWHVILSRATAEGVVGLAVVLAGLIFLVRFLKHQKVVVFVLAVVCFLLTYLLYPGYRLLIPLILFPLPFLFPLKWPSRVMLIGAVLLFSFTTLVISSTAWGRGRFDQTSMFGPQSGGIIKDRISILAQEEGHNQITEVKTYHNKYIIYSRTFVSQYLTYFSPQYLFLQGGLPYRYSVSDFGLLYWTLLPLLVLPLFFVRQMQRRMALSLFYLLLISPMPAPLTLDDVPNVHRTLFMVVPMTLLVAFGVIACLDNIKKLQVRRVVIGTLLIFLGIESLYFFHMYNDHANAVKSYERGDANKEVITELIKQKGNYETVYIPVHDAFPIYYLFFTHNFDPSVIGMVQKNLRVKTIDNIIFSEQTSCPSQLVKEMELKRKILVIDDGNCDEDKRFETITFFSRHDGTVAYRFLTPKLIL